MAENTPRSWPFKVENNAQTLPKQLQNNFEKVQKMTFWTPKMVKNDPSEQSKMNIFLIENFDFGDHLSTFCAAIYPKVGLGSKECLKTS